MCIRDRYMGGPSEFVNFAIFGQTGAKYDGNSLYADNYSRLGSVVKEDEREAGDIIISLNGPLIGIIAEDGDIIYPSSSREVIRKASYADNSKTLFRDSIQIRRFLP
eukprot:TRINITY_DN10322_c0_g1_i2.p1 TRINITY_DN10322_c0_g1~~TRINITY_DN10322_c0_g1_i2.p1  ORF type:complete len:107 (-),score=33.05 TRINITY_DN10322_c0_g1_i2:98-418(-)